MRCTSLRYVIIAACLSLAPAVGAQDTTGANGYELRGDIVSEKELSAPDIIGGSLLNAVALLRPQLLRARGPTSFTSSNQSAERGQLYYRAQGDSNVTKAAGMPSELADLTASAGSL